MKFSILVIIAGCAIGLSGCATGKMAVDHRRITSSLPVGVIVRSPCKIAYLDDGMVPPEVISLALRYQAIRESGRFREFTCLEFPDGSCDIDKIDDREKEWMEEEAKTPPGLAVLYQISYLIHRDLNGGKNESWIFRFWIIEGRQPHDEYITFYRNNSAKFSMMEADLGERNDDD